MSAPGGKVGGEMAGAIESSVGKSILEKAERRVGSLLARWEGTS